jgi:hypothetical protein
LTCFSFVKLNIVKLLGSAANVTTAIPAVINTVDIKSWRFKTREMSEMALIFNKSVANKVVNKHTIIPIALIRSGYRMAEKLWLIPKEEMDATYSAAQVDSA